MINTNLLEKVSRRFLLILWLVPAIGFLFCANNSDWARLIKWNDLTFSDLPGAETFPEQGAIIIRDEGKMEIIGGTELPMSMFERHQIVKILNPRGHRYANVVIPYTPQTQVENIQARTISPQGKIVVLGEKNIYDVNLYPDFIFYSDHRAKLFTMPAIEDGAVIEYRYQMRFSSRNLWPSWNFQDEAPTLRSKFSLIAPAEWELNYRLYDIDIAPSIVKAPQGFKSSYTWEANNVPPLKLEFGMPSRKECVKRLEIAPVGMKTWDDVALWYQQLAEPQLRAGKNVQALAASLTSAIKDQDQRAKILYEWVRDHIRYIAVAIGIGGYQPRPAEHVLANRYGDCKDMTTLLCSLLRQAGIHAYEVLVSTWHNGAPDTSLPSPFQFNHAIAYCPAIGNNGLWMDATAKGCPFGALPWYDQGLPVLVVSESGKSRLLTTPTTPWTSNGTILNWEVTPHPTGEVTIRGNICYTGAPAAEMRENLLYLSCDSRRLWLETELAKRCPGVKLDSFQITGIYPVADSLLIFHSFHTTGLIQPGTQNMIFRPDQILAFDLPDYFRSLNRVHPIRLRFNATTGLDLVVKLPENWLVITPASSDSINSPFGALSWCYALKDANLRAQIMFHLSDRTIEPQNYPEFQNFLDRVRLTMNQLEIVLNNR